MGENVTTEGALEDDVRIGDVWAWGDARLQVTSPRGPCYKLGIRLGRQAMRTVVRAEGLVGWYLRVLVEGEVPVRGPIEVVERHPAGVTVGMAHRALQDRTRAYPDLADLDVMSTSLRNALRRRDATSPAASPRSTDDARRATWRIDWYAALMSGTHAVVVGNRGRIVVPAEVRERAGLAEGTRLVLLETPNGLVLLTRAQLRDRVRDDLSGLDLVADLLADRRAASAAEDSA